MAVDVAADRACQCSASLARRSPSRDTAVSISARVEAMRCRSCNDYQHQQVKETTKRIERKKE